MNTNNKEKYIPALSFDFLTPLYDTTVKFTTRESTFKGEIVRQIKIPADGRLLDLACGTATLTLALKRKFPQSEIFGIDGDAKILKIARRKADMSNAEINFTEAFSSALPYPDEYFDAVASSLFFHHLTTESKQKTLIEVRRILKPGGTLYIADWGKSANFLMKLASVPIQWLDGATTKDNYVGKIPQMLEDAGFTRILETGTFNTMFGTLRLHRARRS
jgi:ubiquinone/menaquinone biosynthesis C-methylase UbiE